MSNASEMAEAVVARQLAAYNDRDIEAMMACWHADAVILAHPTGILAKGAEEIRARHVRRFEERDLYARLKQRMAVGTMVVDLEVVTRNFPAGKGEVDVIAIYEVVGDRIQRAWIRSGEPRFLDQAPL
jgi:putative hydrolase of HD superfamily